MQSQHLMPDTEIKVVISYNIIESLFSASYDLMHSKHLIPDTEIKVVISYALLEGLFSALYTLLCCNVLLRGSAHQ